MTPEIVRRTGPSDMGVIQGNLYQVKHRRQDGRIVLQDKDGGWPVYWHPAGFEVRELGG